MDCQQTVDIIITTVSVSEYPRMMPRYTCSGIFWYNEFMSKFLTARQHKYYYIGRVYRKV